MPDQTLDIAALIFGLFSAYYLLIVLPVTRLCGLNRRTRRLRVGARFAEWALTIGSRPRPQYVRDFPDRELRRRREAFYRDVEDRAA